MHHIQLEILSRLMYRKYLRFSAMRPERVDSNLFQYHLKKLLKDNFVVKVEQGYTLGPKGLQYADRFSSELRGERRQPKTVVGVVLRNDKGDCLLVPKERQPFVGDWLLPAGKIHEGEPLADAAARELGEKAGIEGANLEFQCTVRVSILYLETTISEYICLLMGGVWNGEPGKGEWHVAGDDRSLVPAMSDIIAIDDYRPYHEIAITLR